MSDAALKNTLDWLLITSSRSSHRLDQATLEALCRQRRSQTVLMKPQNLLTMACRLSLPSLCKTVGSISLASEGS